MGSACKSPRKVLVSAWQVAKDVLPAYSHLYSPKKFTQPTLFACLVLRAFLKTDYRGLVEHLRDAPEWCQAIELESVPHFTTFQKAARRLLRSANVSKLLDETIGRVMGRKRNVNLAAIDSTGLESRHTSQYFISRRRRKSHITQTTQYTRYPKLGLLVDCSKHLILGYLTGQGPTTDIKDLEPTLKQTSTRVRMLCLLADAGYDSEGNHELCRDERGILTVIPPTHGRPTTKPAKGRFRRMMQTRFNKKRYGQRWQVETIISMIKRLQGSATKGRSYHARRRDMMLMVLTHNIMILSPTAVIVIQIKVFYRAVLTPFSPRFADRPAACPGPQSNGARAGVRACV